MTLQLTPYDEYPVHQAPYPFSYIPSTDYSWDDGYWFGVFNPDENAFLGTYMRVNPNTDMIGGCALLNVAGRQVTLRFNRCWRPNFELGVGPYKMEVVEPLRKIRLSLARNDSGLTFDLLWEGTSPAFLEDHHVATNRGRRTTDQTRYSQPGKASGWIQWRDQKWDVESTRWSGSRDHSWGLYASRPPLSPSSSLLPPRTKDEEGPQRAMRFWTCFRTEPYSGFFHVHETADGVQCKMNDVFGTPFGGRIFKGWHDQDIELVSGRHEMEFNPGTRILKKATFTMADAQGREWRQVFDIETPPWIVQPMGAFPGSWKDGGTFHTYHGTDLALEWDEGDYSQQPFKYTPYAVTGAAAEEGFNTGTSSGSLVHGPEYLGRVTTYAPDGTVSKGASQIELFINGPYRPYGFE